VSNSDKVSFNTLQKLITLCRENLKKLEIYNINYNIILDNLIYYFMNQ